MPEFRTRQWIPYPIDEVFAFFAEARNLERITPPFLRFSLCDSGVIPMREGTLIDYRLRLHGIPLHWRSMIEVWEPGRRFVDTQVRGPFQRWWHEHTFQEAPGGTWVEDRVQYKLPLGPLGQFAAGWWVARDVRRIFEYRHRAIEQIFPPGGTEAAAPDTAPFAAQARDTSAAQA